MPIDPPILKNRFKNLKAEDYIFDWYELYYKKSTESVNLNLFIFAACLVNDEKNGYFKTSMNFYPWKVYKNKSEEGMMSDYPHLYKITWEDPNHPVIHGIRKSENSEFILSKSNDDFTKYGPNYLGILQANFWGTGFDLLDYGVDIELDDGVIPEGFLNKPK